MAEEAQTAQLIQRFLTRMDHLEFGLMQRHAQEVQALKDTVGNIQRARRAQADEDAPRQMAPASHRGPGALVSSAPARPAEAAPPPVSIAEGNVLELLVQAEASGPSQSVTADLTDSAPMWSPESPAATSQQSSRVGRFSNALVKASRAPSVASPKGPEEFVIASPPPRTNHEGTSRDARDESGMPQHPPDIAPSLKAKTLVDASPGPGAPAKPPPEQYRTVTAVTGTTGLSHGS